MTTRTLRAILVAVAFGCGPSSRPVDATPPPGARAASDPTASPTSTPTAIATPAPAPTATSTATSTATPTAAPIAAPIAAPAVRTALAREPAGTTPLSAAGETVVDPASTFEIELADRLTDARIVLVDAAEAHVAAKDVREIAATTRLTLAPEAPLVPGSRYVLRADGAAQREMHDAEGHAFAPLGFAILVAGTPPPPEPKKPPRKRRR